MKLNRIHIFVTVFFLGTGILFSQGDRCSSIQPFCAGSSLLVFQNSNAASGDNPVAQSGPNYNCLLTQPYPAWFYLKIGEPGNLNFEISQTQNADGSGLTLDVDFIAWGPFTEQDDFCSSSSLSNANLIGCSYSESPRENFTINNALEGQIYVVLITNFDQGPGYISLQQTNTNGGSTDCSIVGSSLGPDQQVCGESQVVLDATNPSASEYIWFVFNENSGSYEVIPNETGPTLTVKSSGNYQVTVRSALLQDEASDDVLIEFFELPVAKTPDVVIGCQDDEGVVYDLYQAEKSLIGDNTGVYTSNYYLTEEDYRNNNPILNPETFEGEVQRLFGTIVSGESNCESLPVEITLEIAESPQLDWNGVTALCVDLNGNLIAPVSIGRALGENYSYEWSVPNDPDGDGKQNAILVLNQVPSARIITLTVSNSLTGCSRMYTTEIKVFSPPAGVTLEITGQDIGGDGYQITAIPRGAVGDQGIYEYSLDNGPWQNDPTFINVQGGTHRITTREINGCGSATSQPVRLIGYPRFFTPNNDGYNDLWNVINDAAISISKVLIFDRYGKLLKQLDPSSGGWDGTFNNKALPADDYWFSVEFRDADSGEVQEFKSHFTLKR